MAPFLRSLILSSLAALASGAALAQSPVVVELFTSQGCSSCPPADALLHELGERPDVIALGFHVDYWDRLGWPDVFASPAYSDRQYAYAPRFGGSPYTPQLVIQGARDEAGYDRAGALAAIKALGAAPARVGAELSMAPNGELTGRVQPLEPGLSLKTKATLWLAGFDALRETHIKRGENAGRSIAYAHIVRSWRALGEWDGATPLDLEIARPEGESGAVLILQKGESGPILGAVRLIYPASPG